MKGPTMHYDFIAVPDAEIPQAIRSAGRGDTSFVGALLPVAFSEIPDAAQRPLNDGKTSFISGEMRK
jgi:hypothetical protein